MIPKTPQTRRLLLLAFAAVGIVFGVLVLAFWGFVRETVVIPLYYLIWLGGLAIRWPPQWVYWAFLAILCAIIGVDTLRKARIRHTTRPLVAEASRASSRYQTWARYCANLHSGYTRENFCFTTLKFLLDLLAEQENLTVAEVEARLATGQIDAPQAVRYLVREHGLPAPGAEAQPRSRWEQWTDSLRERLGFNQADRQAEYAATVEEILQYIEKRLEIESNGPKDQPGIR